MSRMEWDQPQNSSSGTSDTNGDGGGGDDDADLGHHASPDHDLDWSRLRCQSLVRQVAMPKMYTSRRPWHSIVRRKASPDGALWPSASASRSVKCDFISQFILMGLWSILDQIFCYLDAYSLLNCESVCPLWQDYILRQRVWQRAVNYYSTHLPELIHENGWKRLVECRRHIELALLKHTYWKMTNLCHMWNCNEKPPVEVKSLFNRPGIIVWKFLPRKEWAVSVYNSSRHFVLKVHDQQMCRFRALYREHMGVFKKDTLCMDASDHLIAVAGLVSQNVWIYRIHDHPGSTPQSSWHRPRPPSLSIQRHQMLHMNFSVTKVSLHSDQVRLAVLMPSNQIVEIWDVKHSFSRLQMHLVMSDCCHMIWRNETLLVAPLFSGTLMAFDTDSGVEKASIDGGIRRVDALSCHENLVVTGEHKSIKLWSLQSCRGLVSWIATKTYITSVFINDVMVASGSSSGIVKLWDLMTLLKHNVSSIAPLRKITMKGVLHYPIKDIAQFSYTDLIITAKYESKKKKDKIKLVYICNCHKF